MLLGLEYHHGNGEPFYFKREDGVPIILSFIDAYTLKPLVRPDETPSRDWENIRQRRKGIVDVWLK